VPSIYVYICIYIFIYICMYIYIYIYKCVCVCMYIYSFHWSSFAQNAPLLTIFFCQWEDEDPVPSVFGIGICRCCISGSNPYMLPRVTVEFKLCSIM